MTSDGRAKQVLVVEDEWLLAASLEDMLLELGLGVEGPAPTAEVALALIERTIPDFALLDVSLRREKSYAVADELRERGIPFAFLTGHSATDLPEPYCDIPVLAKPVSGAELRRVLSRWLS